MSFLIPITFEKHILVRVSHVVFSHIILYLTVAEPCLKPCPAKKKKIIIIHTPPANQRVVTLLPDSIAVVIQISERCKEIPSTSHLSFFVLPLCLFDKEFFT